MPHGTSRNVLATGVATGVVVTLMLSGCYEYEDPPVQPPAPSASNVATPQGGVAPAAGPSSASARPSHAGAKQAAQRTVDKIGERQRELEKALEDPD